jgi:hypothetical protein
MARIYFLKEPYLYTMSQKKNLSNVFDFIIKPWYESLKNPRESQEKTLKWLVSLYNRTSYGIEHFTEKINSLNDFQTYFPIISYTKLKLLLEQVMRGNYSQFLPEPPIVWVMTRGSTGIPKVLPATKTHLEQIFQCGARALVNYTVKNDDYEIFNGKILNLNFPSTVTTVHINEKTIAYGYSSGTYAKLNPTFGGASLIPSQEEIDTLGTGITKKDWNKRFNFVFEKAQNENVTAAMGVAPVILSFARHMSGHYGKKPKEVWKLHALFCTSVRKIHIKYAPILKKYYGNVPVVEIYSATEGVFAQQFDAFPYVVPNYDAYFFEVKTGKGIKLLCNLERGEWGRLIISSCMFPRYDIGDMIEAMGKNYFRVFGRAKTTHILEHGLYRLLFGWFL